MKASTEGFPGASMKGFRSVKEAVDWLLMKGYKFKQEEYATLHN